MVGLDPDAGLIAALVSLFPAHLSPAEEWEFLEWNVLKPSRSSSVRITCQHFRYEVGRHCVTLLICPIHQGLIPQGEHLTKRCSQWVARQEVAVGWCSEVA